MIFLPFNDEDALNVAFENNEICAVIIEGIQGVGGINVATKTFLQSIRRNCDQYNAVFIADSVQCGYGRTGKFFSHDHADVEADIYSMAKGMGNGFPVAGILISPKFEARHFMLGTTFGGNHLACAAALAVIEVIQRDDLIRKAKVTGNYLIEELKKLEKVQEVRGKGLMIGIELPPGLSQVKDNLLFKHRIFTGAAKPNVIRLLPALNITRVDADIFLEAFSKELAN